MIRENIPDLTHYSLSCKLHFFSTFTICQCLRKSPMHTEVCHLLITPACSVGCSGCRHWPSVNFLASNSMRGSESGRSLWGRWRRGDYLLAIYSLLVPAVRATQSNFLTEMKQFPPIAGSESSIPSLPARSSLLKPSSSGTSWECPSQDA